MSAPGNGSPTDANAIMGLLDYLDRIAAGWGLWDAWRASDIEEADPSEWAAIDRAYDNDALFCAWRELQFAFGWLSRALSVADSYVGQASGRPNLDKFPSPVEALDRCDAALKRFSAVLAETLENARDPIKRLEAEARIIEGGSFEGGAETVGATISSAHG